ncbi:hypothetical protein SAMN05216474_2021 [Lishizhenia tianjinensis]|uniref:Uncharacterized protein n=1 Tax=Lishizhenia tianjinensis TaxID=477690 RepID=A0A1I7AF70_9FLAO|nr:hypothetical protein [Lishizhenia tianjinensis]SFT73490.1 hypothetical protein SAMN05216474_2021 [Lishizhenia tianjinensis]
MQRGQKPNARRRKLNYQRSILQEELALYNRQKEILPVLGVLLLFGVLFLFLNFKFSVKGNSFDAHRIEQGFEFTIEDPGVHQIDILNHPNIISDNQATHLKTEVFIKKEGKKLYHYYLTNKSVSGSQLQRLNYYFREAGNYQLTFRHSLITTTQSIKEPAEVKKVTLTPRQGNAKLITWGMRLFLLGVIIILLLKDYFGPVKNYQKIIQNKEYNLKNKSLYIALSIAVLWLVLGYALASSGYGFAGYNNDMHAPAKSVQIDNNYYIN